MEEFQIPTPSVAHQDQLDKHGYVVLSECIPEVVLEQLILEVESLWETEGDLAGREFKQEKNARRLANLVEKSRRFDQVVTHRDSLTLVRYVLGAFKLSSLNARSANPMSASGQPLHCDGGYLPDKKGPKVANVVWCLDDFTVDNGTIRVIPGTHVTGKLPQDVLDHPEKQHPDEELIKAKAGSLIVMNAHLWHSGVENRTHLPRRALHAYYCRRDQPQQQFQQALLSAETRQIAKGLLRYVLALDDAPLKGEREGASNVSGFLQ